MRQFKAEGRRDDLFAGTPDTFFMKYLLAKAASCKDFGLLVVDINERGSRTDHSLEDKIEENRALPQRTSAMCTEFPFGGNWTTSST